MAILNVDQSAVILTLKAISDSDEFLLEQIKKFIPESRFIILNIRDIFFTTVLLGDIINAFNLFNEHWEDQIHKMVIVQADESAKRIFTLTHLSEKIPVFDSVEEALQKLPLSPGI